MRRHQYEDHQAVLGENLGEKVIEMESNFMVQTVNGLGLGNYQHLFDLYWERIS